MSSASLTKDIDGAFEPVARELRRAVGNARYVNALNSLVEALVFTISEDRQTFLPPSPLEPITEAERHALLSVGVDPLVSFHETPRLKAKASYASLIATSLSLRDAAPIFQVQESRLRQRLLERSLIGVRAADGRAWRIPVFQVSSGRELPGLRTVLKAIRSDASPLQIAAFFDTPQPDLFDENEEAMTPSAWLASGGSAEAVAVLAQEI
jgi:hypothetical protein